MREVPRPPTAGNLPDPRVDKLLHSVNAGHYRLTLKEFSPRVGLSQRRLGRLFREQVGVSFHAYLRMARQRKAAELLVDDARPLKEVAASVGYPDVSHFNHDFRRVFGASPRSFRRLRNSVSIALSKPPSQGEGCDCEEVE